MSYYSTISRPYYGTKQNQIFQSKVREIPYRDILSKLVILMNPKNIAGEVKFCKYCLEYTVYIDSDCIQCESTSEYDSDSSSESNYDNDPDYKP